MESRQFDNLTKFLARRVSRRNAVGGTAGLAAAMSVPALHQTLAQGATPEATPAGAEHLSLLFVQVATGGSFTAKTDSPGWYVLTLNGVGAHAVQFADRPAHLAGTLATADLVDESLFDPNDPPNAALVADTDAGLDILVIELYKPHYDAASQTLTYEAKPVEGDQQGWLAQFGSAQKDLAMAETLHAASLFIDSVTLNCYPNGCFCFPLYSYDGCCQDLFCSLSSYATPQCNPAD